MDRLKILITGSGAPGIKGTIHSLKTNYDNREVELVGTDSNHEVIGKYLCDKFFKISSANEANNYLNDLNRIIVNENIDVILPQNTSELDILSKNKNLLSNSETKIVISGIDSINIANNKYLLIKECEKLGIPVGNYFLVNSREDLIKSAKILNWPKERIVIKPPQSNGSRGVRIIDESINLKEMYYKNKPTTMYTKMDDINNVLGQTFPELIVSNYHSGQEYTVDIFNYNKITVIPRKRVLIRSGITFNGVLDNNSEIIEYSKILSKHLKLKYCFGFQFILDERGIPNLIECNPRVQGTMVMSTLAGANIIYSSVKAVIGEKIPDFKINWNSKFMRYWGGLSIIDDEKIVEI